MTPPYWQVLLASGLVGRLLRLVDGVEAEERALARERERHTYIRTDTVTDTDTQTHTHTHTLTHSLSLTHTHTQVLLASGLVGRVLLSCLRVS